MSEPGLMSNPLSVGTSLTFTAGLGEFSAQMHPTYGAVKKM